MPSLDRLVLDPGRDGLELLLTDQRALLLRPCQVLGQRPLALEGCGVAVVLTVEVLDVAALVEVVGPRAAVLPDRYQLARPVRGS
jgi:hypothetical protein